jgi:hypothetical protein
MGIRAVRIAEGEDPAVVFDLVDDQFETDFNSRWQSILESDGIDVSDGYETEDILPLSLRCTASIHKVKTTS